MAGLQKKVWPVGLIWGIVLVLYWPTLGVYFAQDDFFHFKVALGCAQGRLGVWRCFGFYPFEVRGIAFYRPLFREMLYNVFYGCFGLRALPFRVLQILMQGVNIYLVYKVALELLNDRRSALFSTLFFGLGAANVGILYYLAGGVQAQGATMFGLLAVVFFLEKKRVWALMFYVLALASHEIAIGVPIILVGVYWYGAGEFGWRNYFWLAPYVLIVGVYLFLNLYVIGLSSGEEQYRMVFSLPRLVNTLGWYIAWSWGLPEMTVDFVGSGLKLDPRLMEMWGKYYLVIWPTFLGSGVLAGFGAIRNIKKYEWRKLALLGGWFVVGILPVMFLPIHKKTYYLALAMPGFWMGVGYIFGKIGGRAQMVLVGLLLGLNVIAVELGEKTYWAINRAKAAEKVLGEFKYEHPWLPEGTVIYIFNDPEYEIFSEEWGGTSKQAFYALSGSDAFQLLYQDFKIEVFYEDMDEFPAELGEEAIAFRARIL